MIDYDKFEKSLKHLEVQYNNYLTIDDRDDLGVLEKEAIAESVIQRFETCYDTMWKALKRYLNEELGLPEIPNSPWPLFQIAARSRHCCKSQTLYCHWRSAIQLEPCCCWPDEPTPESQIHVRWGR